MSYLTLNFVVLLLITFFLFYIVGLINKLAKRVILPQWIILLIASLVFYGINNYVYLIYIGISTLLSYFASILMQYKFFVRNKDSSDREYSVFIKEIKNHSERKIYENTVCALAIVINVGILVVLKYYNFFAGSINNLFGQSLSIINFIVPLGISFYTFSLVSYNVDCAKREITAEKNPLKLLLYTSYFPRVLQGPISSFSLMKKNGLFSDHHYNDTKYLKPLSRIAIGLVKKIIIADVIGIYVNNYYSNISSSSGAGLILCSVFYLIQLYCDFSGFMDMSIGVSGLFGIDLEENFDMPFLSSSVGEFWRRWHITLGAWLRKYIYIPLGGNRVKKFRWVINILIVWLVSGLWHGANTTFIVWGLLMGSMIVLEGLFRKRKKSETEPQQKKNNILLLVKIVLTILYVNFTFIFFRSQSVNDAGLFISRIFRPWIEGTSNPFASSFSSKTNWLLILAGSFFIVLSVYKLLANNINLGGKTVIKKLNPPFLLIISCACIAASIFVLLYLKSLNLNTSSFIYFEF